MNPNLPACVAVHSRSPRWRSKSFWTVSIVMMVAALLTGCGGGSIGSALQLLTIAPSAPPDGTVGATYAGTTGFSFAASGGTPPYAWNWTATAGSSLPPGLTLSPTGVVSGIPTGAGVYLVSVQVKDASSPAVQASTTYPIAVDNPAVLVISSPAPPNGVLSASYAGDLGYSLIASGGVGPYVWSWVADVGSSLPPGLTLSPAGVISGTPSTMGLYSFTITATDSASPAAQSSTDYTISIIQAGGLMITSGALPGGLVGFPYGRLFVDQGHRYYFFPVAATGGAGAYTWDWAAAPGSTLPPGLGVGSLLIGGCSSGCFRVQAISGTPTAAGTYDVLLTVTDSATPPAQSSTHYKLVIHPLP